ncbi:MAG: hypothetical protein U0269_33830 [Polyangiales bacterium]
MRFLFRTIALLALSSASVACGPGRPMLLPPNDSSAGVDAASDGGGGGGQCTRQQDCDDGIACTDETCVFGGVCERTANDRLCPMGQRCFIGRGCAAGNSCMRNEDCNDNVPCTRDVCGAGGVCQNIRDDSRCTPGQRCSYTLDCVEPGRCGTDPDCDDGRFCNGPERCTMGMCAAGTAPDCSDGDMCTGDVCNEAMRMCEHVPLNPCGGAVQAGTYDISPSFSYTCGAGSLAPVSSVTLEVTGSTVVVRGFPVELRGTHSSGMFNATGTWSQGGCGWQFSLLGAFTMPNQFRGSLNLDFQSCSISLNCIGASPAITGTRR